MSEYRVKYQAMPFNYTSPQQLIVEADSKAAAYAAVHDYLSRRGVCMVLPMSHRLADMGVTREELAAFGIGDLEGSGSTQITNIQEYTVRSTGKVLGG